MFALKCIFQGKLNSYRQDVTDKLNTSMDVPTEILSLFSCLFPEFLHLFT